jgi:hypothetical protein
MAVLGILYEIKQELEQVCRLFRLHADDTGSKHLVDKKDLGARHGVLGDNRMGSVERLASKSAPTALLAPVSMADRLSQPSREAGYQDGSLLSRFRRQSIARVNRLQPNQHILHDWRHAFKQPHCICHDRVTATPALIL